MQGKLIEYLLSFFTLGHSTFYDSQINFLCILRENMKNDSSDLTVFISSSMLEMGQNIPRKDQIKDNLCRCFNYRPLINEYDHYLLCILSR